MAKSIVVIIFFFFSIFPSLLHCRTTPCSFKTTLLNVTASIQKTHQVFTFKRHHHHHQQQLRSSSSSLSAQIYSRTFLHETPQSNYTYRSLTSARLERDSGRVNSLLTQLDRALKGEKLKVDKLQAPVIFGMSQGTGEYFARVGIGKPPSGGANSVVSFP